MKWITRAGKWLAVGAAITVMGAAGAGCLTRPVGTQSPTTKVNFTSQQQQSAVDKVDLLFMIDNSSSMGDKQAILADAVPQLLKGLLKPKCVDKDTRVPIASGQTADPAGNTQNNYLCPDGSEPEFKPVTDMHIGIISSSLGSFGSDLCDASPSTYVKHPNDKAYLLNRLPGDSTLPGNANFLAWYPVNSDRDTTRHPPPPPSAVTETAIGDQNSGLTGDFTNLVKGVEQYGCGLEAQLESVYRFLIQPDPRTTVTIKSDQATLSTDIDTTIIKQRADFLRPDSLVAVIMLTDEDDSFADPLSFYGRGWKFAYRDPLWRPTSICATDPASPDCVSCFLTLKTPCDQSCETAKKDPSCQKNSGKYTNPATNPEDSANVRFHHMKQRFGVDPQFPVERYIRGFTKSTVPDSTTEHDLNGNYLLPTGPEKCTNPLFASKLLISDDKEKLCNLEQGTRTSDLVFFAVIGGVPNELLHFNADTGKNAPEWVQILGKAPENFNYDGISPYMRQSTDPRTEYLASLAPGTEAFGQNGNDPVVGRDYNTNQGDLQYACTFNLPAGTPDPCADVNSPSCDCNKSGVFPPLCSAKGAQTKAKAYPTIRPFRVVEGLGLQGIIASLCPITLDGQKDGPTYGYNPAVATIVNRLKNMLMQQCLPRKLTRDPVLKEVPCLVLAQLPEGKNCSDYSDSLQPPDEGILSTFNKQHSAPGFSAVCKIPQKAVDQGATCKNEADILWCYVENLHDGGQPAGSCAQALAFSAGSGNITGARFFLQCIQQFTDDNTGANQ